MVSNDRHETDICSFVCESSSDFNMVYDFLNHLYGGTLVKPQTGVQTPLIGQFATFDQQAFMSPPSSLNTDQTPNSSVLKWLSQSMRLYAGKNWYWPTSGLVNWTIPDVKTSPQCPSNEYKKYLVQF